MVLVAVSLEVEVGLSIGRETLLICPRNYLCSRPVLLRFTKGRVLCEFFVWGCGESAQAIGRIKKWTQNLREEPTLRSELWPVHS